MQRSWMLRLMLACACWMLIAAPMRAQASTRVSVMPTEVMVRNGGTSQLTIEVADVQGLYGIDLTVRYDPSVIEVVDANPGTSAVEVSQGTFLDSGTTVLNSADNAAGVIRFAMTQLNPSEAKSGTGNLILFTVRAKREGAASTITVEKADLANRDGILISTALIAGRVVVPSAPPPAPGITPIATATTIPTQPATAPPATPPPTATALPPGATAAPTVTSAPTPQTQPATATSPAPAGNVTATPVPPAGENPAATAVPDNALGSVPASPTSAPLPAGQEPLPQTAPPTSLNPTAEPARPITIAAAPAQPMHPTQAAQQQPGLLNPKLELALVSGVCGSGFIITCAVMAIIFILLLQRQTTAR